MRSVTQIYSEIVTVRNNYLQLTELNSGRSNSKVSMLNLLTYVMAVSIHTYEVILDIFQLRLAETIKGRVNGTPDWYALIARKFQYDKVTEQGDKLIFNEDTLKIEYETTDTTHRIIEQAAWQMNEDESSLLLKVVKANENSNEVNSGIPYSPLTDQELTAFKKFIQQIKFVGANIESQSIPGDILTIVADEDNPIFYDDSYVTAAQALEEIREAIINFANGLTFNDMFYYQSVLDVLRKTEHVTDIGNSIKVYIKSWDKETGEYGENSELIGRTRLKSGFIRLLDENSVTTINTDNLKLVPESRMSDYYD